MKLIDIEYPFINVKLNIQGIDKDEDAMIDTGFTLGINVPIKYKNALIKEATIKGKRISKLPVNIANGSRYLAFSTICNIKIDDKKFDARVVCMGNKFLIGREVIKQIMDNPFLSIKCEKIEVTI